MRWPVRRRRKKSAGRGTRAACGKRAPPIAVLERRLDRDGETLAALGTTRLDDLAAAARLHAGTKAVIAHSLQVARLVGALGRHDSRLGDGKKGADGRLRRPLVSSAKLAARSRRRLDSRFSLDAILPRRSGVLPAAAAAENHWKS